jgi:hypothetical protein
MYLTLLNQVLLADPDHCLTIAIELRRNEHSEDPTAEIRDVHRIRSNADSSVRATQLVEQQIRLTESPMGANPPGWHHAPISERCHVLA